MTVPAPGVAGRYGMRVRTPELPMAFTWGEFARGAGFAWLAFQLVFPLSYPVMSIVVALSSPDPFESVKSAVGWALLVVMMSFLYALPWSIGALLLIGGPAAWGLGLGLRRVASLRVHLVAFALLGAVVGAVVAWIAGTIMSMGASATVFAIDAAVVTGASVAYGWRRTARRALADDARLIGHAPDGEWRA
ncbi:hypothetical protein MUN74_07515 [Agromyces endophyticus]|uniref:hypothetical protein n=1 Tax=Agromyces sp. H17E-10 TaxID=2932244 RepID=UPI001FD20FE8|nr:hypothetical protein [Agromyces sp. H17E-10]UOQ90741.1 hypothetical protein MUN74_07515 [Agromyces sp. H17E-10]